MCRTRTAAASTRASAQFQGEAFSLATVELFTVDGTDEVHGHTHAVGGSHSGFSPGGVLLAQGVDHVFQVAVLHGGNRLLDLDALQTGNFELRIHFESGGEFEILTFFDLFRIHGRGASRAQFVLDDGLDEVVLHHFIGNAGVSHGTEHLLDDGNRSLARTETVDATGFGQAIQFFAHGGVNGSGRYSDGKTAFQTLGCLYRNLHSFTSFNSALRADPLLPPGKPGVFLFIKTTTVFVMRKYDATL